MTDSLKRWTTILIAVLTLSAAAIVPSTASAYRDNWIPVSRYVADKAWSPWGNPCGAYPIVIVPHLPGGDAGLSTWLRGDAGNYTTNYDCVIYLAWDQVSWRSWPVFCTLIVHERGHLSFPGPLHSGSRANIMYHGIDRAIYPGCK